MAAVRPSITQATVQAWRDTVAALRALAGPALVVLLITMALVLARVLLLPAGIASRTLLISFVIGCAQSFLLTPYMIAVHRFIILGERTARYELAPGTHRFQLFFLWSIALSICYWLPSFALSTPVSPLILGILWLLLWLVVMVVLSVISLRLIILFPAIAVDAPGATWPNAMADTRGNVWRIFFICLLGLLPVSIALVVLAVTALNVAAGRPASAIGVLFAAILRGAIGIIGPTLAVVIASRLYQQLGNRVNRPD
jgi:hypothetical protein